MDDIKKEIKDFIDWARDCGEEVFYIFEETDEAIEKFYDQKDK